MEYYVNDASYVEGIQDPTFKKYAKISSSKRADVKNKPMFTPVILWDLQASGSIYGVIIKLPGISYQSVEFEKPMSFDLWEKFMIPVEDYVPYSEDINAQNIDKLRELISEYGKLCEITALMKSQASEMMESNPIGGAKLYKKAGSMVTPVKRELFELVEKLELK
ncbi:hypothetical protein BI036_gp167 [Morganella phage vB_MmoM_MP1]|uniref:Uncharacterized protein n=1 Tax=Morganella phage vB_MmoM_MP1 TaxID=1852628 RepID=A0A192YAG6_9CAUD|nr:hypothetical protein BI036_gp167 [Morganella phage vB_MmoM_MP1]ANM46493.1 hypothetical protein MP1_gp0227 [Morganella phage vB_MmoM_MP1]